MIITREWCMPNSNTFDIKPIKNLIGRYFSDEMFSIDPFANKNKIAKITNDIDKSYDTDYHLDAFDFLKQFPNKSVDFVFYDPPYSPRQITEVYQKMQMSVNMQTTQASYWSKQKSEIGRICKPNSYVLTCSWNSGGIGKKYGFEIVEILMVAHGGWHNDTICVIEKRVD